MKPKTFEFKICWYDGQKETRDFTASSFRKALSLAKEYASIKGDYCSVFGKVEAKP